MGRTPAGNAVTNRVWTAVLDNLAAYAAPVPLVPQNAGDRISQVVTVTGAGTAAGGAFTLTSTFERAVGGAAPAQAAGTLRFIALEMPTGAVNGVNTVFTALHTPVGGMQVSLNGQQQDPATVAQGGLGAGHGQRRSGDVRRRARQWRLGAAFLLYELLTEVVLCPLQRPASTLIKSKTTPLKGTTWTRRTPARPSWSALSPAAASPLVPPEQTAAPAT